MSLQETYKKKIAPELQKEFDIKNINAVPAIKQITVNVGLGIGLKEAKYLETAENTLRRITGQQPVKTKARKSIANFKIRQGNVVGMKVTLRGPRMWDFLDKLINVTFARIRDFRGLSPKSFDAQGNYSVGFSEHIAFPEIRSDEIEVIHGLQVNIETTAKNSEQAKSLLTHLGFPFKKA
ncbi:50S ribosomal protein L5 [Patescibacteria group bacterium]|nr:50S ribosomal protein L5 [Patescibacteria group bacterium]MBU1705866.1 50S ribosomal protein L5 [Patescibacteria group bacterium]